jgi:hypothetical protein
MLPRAESSAKSPIESVESPTDDSTSARTLTGSRFVDAMAFGALLVFMLLTSRRLAVYWRPPAKVPPTVESSATEQPTVQDPQKRSVGERITVDPAETPAQAAPNQE